MSETTFGCGAFLPGRGPFNFPDFIEGGTTNGGNPPDPDPPGTKTEADLSDDPVIGDPGSGGGGPGTPEVGEPETVPPGGGGGGGGGGATSVGPQGPAAPSPAGPSTPGPQRAPGAPGAGPTNRLCKCVIDFNNVSFLPPRPKADGSESWTARFPQKCKQLPFGSIDTNDTDARAYILNLFPDAYDIRREGAGVSFADCNTGTYALPNCNGGCSILQFFWSVPGDGPGGPISPGETPPDPPGPGPRPISPGPTPGGGNGGVTSAGPQSGAGAPVSPGGGGGNGGVTGTGPQSGAAPPVTPPIGEGSPYTPLAPQKPIGPITPGAGPAVPPGTGPSGIEPPRRPGGGGNGGPNSGTPTGPQAPGPGPSLPDNNTGGNGGDPVGTLPEFGPEARSNLVGAGILGRSSHDDLTNLYTALGTVSSLDLGDPRISKDILVKRPSGFEDEEIFFDDTPEKSIFVLNNSRFTDIFSDVIDNNILYLLQNQSSFGDWSSKRAGGVTPTTVYQSLNEETREILSTILNYDRSPITRGQIYHLIGSRILDGTISKVTKGSLRRLASGSEKETPLVITRSRSEIVNETIALGLIERNYYPLEPSSSTGRAGETLKNNKTLSSDIDRFISVTVNGDSQRYYVKDDDTFIGRSSLSLKDGEYFDVTLGGETTRLYAQSEKDHAYFVPEKTRQIALNILGADAYRTLTVSGDPSGIELDYSLSTPRENLYFLSCVLSSITTQPDLSNSRHVKETTAKYEYVSLENIDEINEYIKYKNNHQTFILDDEDLLLDYVEGTGEIFLSQNDVIVDSPKENKTIPLLTRQIPWYILLYPTNKTENNPFNAKSQIVDITLSSSNVSPSVTRQLRTSTSIVPGFRDTFNQFVSVELAGRGAEDVYQRKTNQARINTIKLSNKLINSGYQDAGGASVAASTYIPRRSKTGYRLMSEIILDLDTNYLLGLNGIGKSLTEFDVLSRLNFKQFNLLSRTESYNIIKQALFNGMVNNVKVTPGTKNADSKLAIRKTQLVRKKVGADEADQYPEIKATNFNRSITPPTTEKAPTFTSFEPAVPPTSLP